MTLDSIYMLLADKKILRKNSRKRKTSVATLEAATSSNKDGRIRGRDKDGNPIEARITGQSLASRLNAELAAKNKEADLQANETSRQTRIRKRNEKRAAKAEEERLKQLEG